MESISIVLINNNNDEKTFRPKLSLKTQFAFGVGHVLNDIYSAVWLSYFIVYLTKVRGFDDWAAGFLILLGQIADAVANVVIGKASDYHLNVSVFRKFGRRKTWHLIGVIVNLISMAFIFVPFAIDSYKLRLLYFSICVIFFQFGWAAVQITHLALIPEITPNEDERTKLGATRQLFTVLSSVLVYATSWVAFGVGAENAEFNPEYVATFGYIVIFGSVVGLACSVVFYLNVKEDYSAGGTLDHKVMESSELFTNIKFYQIVLVYMFSMLFVNSSQVLIPPFLSETLGMNATSLAIVPLIMYTASGITSLTLALMKRKCDHKTTYAIGTVSGLGAMLWLTIRWNAFGFVNNEIYCVVLFIGIASATVAVTILGQTADFIGTNTGSSALIYSIMTVSDKLINGFTIYAIQHIHQDSTSISYYKDVISWECGGALLLASIAVFTIKGKQIEREGYITLA